MLQAGKITIMPTGRTQTIISYLIIILLILIAVAILFKQQSYQNYTLQNESGSDNSILSNDIFGKGFSATAVGDVESYDSGNLYEKIDGKADLYLANGFVSLQSRRFVDKSAKDKWAEVYIYDMANGENSFAIYSLQKRSDNTPLNWAQFGYATSDSLYAAADEYYLEVSLSSDDASLFASAEKALKKLVASLSSGKTEIPFLNLFPKENLVADSFKFINADAFGSSDLKNIFAAEYKNNENSVTAYLTKDNSADTYDKYYKFLMDNGGKESPCSLKMPDCRIIELFGTTDIIFKVGDYFAGVRGSVPVSDLQTTAQKLYESLSAPRHSERSAAQ